MDRETAVRMWREACGKHAADANCPPTGMMLEQFARRVEAAERERCAKLCERQNWPDDSDSDYLAGCEFAARIRA